MNPESRKPRIKNQHPGKSYTAPILVVHPVLCGSLTQSWVDGATTEDWAFAWPQVRKRS